MRSPTPLALRMQLEEERKRLEAEEAARRAREEDQLSKEAERLSSERAELEAFLQGIEDRRNRGDLARFEEEEWHCTIECSALPR